MTKCTRITRSDQAIARNRAHTLICAVRNELKQYRFDSRLVGSGAWGTMVNDPNGKFDLDYQIEITKNSKEYYTDNKGFSKAGKIKEDFFEAFQSCVGKGEHFEKSTTAITLINSNSNSNGENTNNYSIDFVIVFNFKDCTKIIRRNDENSYVWNELPSKNEHTYDYFKSLDHSEKEKLVEEIIKIKCVEKSKPDGPDRKSSYEIFLSVVSNYENNR